MDHERLARELVRRLRGPRSQAALSRRLGYTTNVAYAWEAGRRFPSASDFFRLATRAGVDLRAELLRFWGTAPGFNPPPDVATAGAVTQLLLAMRHEHSVAQLARRTGASRLTISRWLKGDGEPRLPDLLRMVEAATQRLLPFIAVFADPESLPSTQAAWRDLQAQLRVAYDLPWSHAVLRALELQSNSRRRNYGAAAIAAQLGISQREVDESLRALRRARQIRLVNGRFVPARVMTVDTRGDEQRNRRLKAHWARVALDRLEHRPGGDLFSYSLFTVSEADHARIRALHAAYFEQIRAIARASQPAERIVLANLQLVSLLDRPAADG